MYGAGASRWEEYYRRKKKEERKSYLIMLWFGIVIIAYLTVIFLGL